MSALSTSRTIPTSLFPSSQIQDSSPGKRRDVWDSVDGPSRTVEIHPTLPSTIGDPGFNEWHSTVLARTTATTRCTEELYGLDSEKETSTTIEVKYSDDSIELLTQWQVHRLLPVVKKTRLSDFCLILRTVWRALLVCRWREESYPGARSKDDNARSLSFLKRKKRGLGPRCQRHTACLSWISSAIAEPARFWHVHSY